MGSFHLPASLGRQREWEVGRQRRVQGKSRGGRLNKRERDGDQSFHFAFFSPLGFDKP